MIATVAGATNADGASLIAIPLAGAATTNDARAITPDGLWVVGVGDAPGDSGNPTHGFLYDVAGGTAIM